MSNSGFPYITRSFCRELLISDFGYSPATTNNHLNPNNPKYTMGGLVEAGICQPYGNGFIIIDQGLKSALLIIKNSGFNPFNPV